MDGCLSDTRSQFLCTHTQPFRNPLPLGHHFHIWKSFAIFFIAFLIHNHLLAPLIVYHRRSGLYLASVFCLTVIFALVRYEYIAIHEPYPPRQHISQKNGTH